MQKEQEYANIVGTARLKKFGQFFTPYEIADFMAQWVIQKHGTVLDPAVGNSVFFNSILRLEENSRPMVGYEIDDNILSFFGTVPGSVTHNEDFLFADWSTKYDCIICNPPYNKFQSIGQRDLLYGEFYEHTGISFTKYTNQYILFLIKSLYQLKANGRLAFIIPSEFLNSKYGDKVKELLLKDGILRAVVNFQNDRDIFFNSMTTCCIVLVENTPRYNCAVEFVNITDVTELKHLDIFGNRLSQSSIEIDCDKLVPEKKWLPLLKNNELREYRNTISCRTLFTTRRGIATGDNDYFLFSLRRIESLEIPIRYFTRCISKSMDVKRPFFEEKDFIELSSLDKNVYLLDIKEPLCESVAEYISQGEKALVHEKYLPKHRKPWYSQESKRPADIWIVSAGRGEIKVIRNLTDVVNLTTFHAVYVTQEYKALTDAIFCYLLTPIGQELLKHNKKELGGGLDKFQPNDLNEAKMLDLRLLDAAQLTQVNLLYEQMKTCRSRSQMAPAIDELNDIFSNLLL